MVSSGDLSLMPDLIQTGVIEPSLTNFLINSVKVSSTVIDVGANIGYFTVLLGYLVGPSGKVISYEANPTIFSLLQDKSPCGYVQAHASEPVYVDLSCGKLDAHAFPISYVLLGRLGLPKSFTHGPGSKFLG